MAEVDTSKAKARNALELMRDARDIIDYLTSITQHADSLEATNGREIILSTALEKLNQAEGPLEVLAKEGES